MSDRVTRTIYISSGLKNGFYTLRSQTVGTVGGRSFETDIYLRNLSTDPGKAEFAARAYFERVYGWQPSRDVVFAGFADFDLCPWGKSLAPWERRQLAQVEEGTWPFGKHQGMPIADAPDGYVMYWAKCEPDSDRKVSSALIAKCRDMADERGLFAAADARKQAQAAADAGSMHVGTVGQRADFVLTLRSTFQYDGTYGTTYGHVLVDGSGNVFLGKLSNPLGEQVDSRTFRRAEIGDVVTLKATVKAHGERDGVRQTVFQRPKVLRVHRAVAAA